MNRIVGYNKSVNDVEFTIKKGETVGLVGESGSGKTTLGRCIVRLYDSTAGSIKFNVNGKMTELTNLSTKEMKNIRKNFQMLFQDVYSSLDTRMKISKIVTEPLDIHNVGTKKERIERAKELMIKVGLSENDLEKYPHQFSGGQRQRIGITRALSINPEFIICDEPVSALDVSIQAQILNLLKDLQEEFKLTYLFISHDLGVVQHICDRVAVMYLGKIVETASVKNIFKNPQHPYTEALLNASPKPHPKFRNKVKILSGEVPNPANTPKGCHFESRCPYSKSICKEEYPPLQEIKASEEQYVACHFSQEINLKGI